jgi:hypothetical protein
MSFAELVMTRIGHLVGVLSLLFVAPLLPFIAVFVGLAKATGWSETGYRPGYRPGQE